MNQLMALAPFGLESILLYYQITNSENLNLKYKSIIWFDNNSSIWGRYSDSFISQPYYSSKIKIVICTQNEKTYSEIKNQYTALGYDTESFEDYFSIKNSTQVSEYCAAKMVDVNLLSKLKKDLKTTINCNNPILKLRRMQRLYDLQEVLDSKFIQFEERGFAKEREEIFLDKNGDIHIWLHTLDLSVTDRCSLRCRFCANMMQYFDTPQNISTEEITRDFNQLLTLIDWVDDIAIIGGEPFINNDLLGILESIVNNPQTKIKVGMLRIVTNGTIVPNDSLCEFMARHSILVCISNYKNFSRHLDDCVDKFQKYGVLHVVLDIPNWGYICQLEQERSCLDLNELMEKRRECSTRCRAIGQGRFYLCSFLKSACKLGAIPQNSDTYVDLFDADVKGKLAKYLSNNLPLPTSCSWCSGDPVHEKWDVIPAAEQIDNRISYLKYESDLKKLKVINYRKGNSIE